MAKAELFQGMPLLGSDSSGRGAYPVTESSDREAIRVANGPPAEGWATGVFLDGTAKLHGVGVNDPQLGGGSWPQGRWHPCCLFAISSTATGALVRGAALAHGSYRSLRTRSADCATGHAPARDLEANHLACQPNRSRPYWTRGCCGGAGSEPLCRPLAQARGH